MIDEKMKSMHNAYSSQDSRLKTQDLKQDGQIDDTKDIKDTALIEEDIK